MLQDLSKACLGFICFLRWEPLSSALANRIAGEERRLTQSSFMVAVCQLNWTVRLWRAAPCPIDAWVLAPGLRSGAMKGASRLFRAVGFRF